MTLCATLAAIVRLSSRAGKYEPIFRSSSETDEATTSAAERNKSSRSVVSPDSSAPSASPGDVYDDDRPRKC